MLKYIVRGPARECEEINATSLDEAMNKVESEHPGKQIAADATEVIYVCDSSEEPEACQARLR